MFDTLRAIARDLERLNIPYAVAGDLALFHYGLRRFSDYVELLVTREDLIQLHKELEGRGYLPKFKGAKSLYNIQTGVLIEFLITSEFLGGSRAKPVSFLNPQEVAHESNGVRYPNLPNLIELKLASGIANPPRLRDIADIQQLIKAINLPRNFAEQLYPYVREEFERLWEIGNSPKRYVRPIDKSPGSMAEESAQVLNLERNELEGAGISIETKGDQLLLVTEDPEVAAKYESMDYIERLNLFAVYAGEVPGEDVKGSATKSPSAIAKRVAEASRTGECVSLTLLNELRQDYRILATDGHYCDLEQYGDHPLKVNDRLTLNVNQIAEFRWRSSGELAVTAVWKASRSAQPRS